MEEVFRSLRNRLSELIGLVTRFGCPSASNSSKKTSSASSSMPPFDHSDSMKDGGDSLKYVPQQPRSGRGASSATASTIKASLASAEMVPPLKDAHRRTSSKSRRRARATKEHHSSPNEHKDDIGYQQFLDFLNSPSESPPPQNLGGAITSTEGHDQLIEERGCQLEVPTKEENSNANESCVVDSVDKFGQALDHGEEEDTLLSISNFAELEETDALPCAEKDTSSKDIDSAMAWCALTAVLGCQAPSSVIKQAGGKMKQKVQLWGIDSVSEDIPDLPFDDRSFSSVDSSLSEGAPDLNEISFDESDDDEDSLFIVPDVEDAQDFIYEDEYKKTSVKEAADSTLSWSALALLLGAPAPASVTKKTKNVWKVSDEGSSEVIPVLH
mmetsp:Transcript_24636/g.37340  ORF Transcript_24636/g.37340 Transcript_24636/m.37340 type:complete len:384 (+) Transcript_24636:134-1285(+)|eukprot:scaffold2248_cov136-Skeletonema_dohrnii-CCMP3373.AAC.7